MSELQDRYDDAMFDFGMNDYESCIRKLRAILDKSPDHFDARLALGMAHYRIGDLESAIREGHLAEQLRPREQLVHTNLSLFYMKSGDKKTAEHHGLQARIAGWRDNSSVDSGASDPELKMAAPKPENIKIPEKFPDMPWKKNKPLS
jgi:predicted Zn-dependent protease